ncbi:MAG: 3-deoxy-manno-octulosonate cytidylyltransferase [Methylophaga sp.]|uniref:3-deoxy-manno-octulosonate cytidylyltransferase n=1 Tax=Methylophaga sp. UBA678 TaxID=1946901 RepID=UPI000C61DADB|nr:3-deoxy-manno-octulosonate cytidylyltransferase [Methylophaga sp. UBA678]MAX52490.1 3-deoxy-manno-octulosonate cytidylyltransferase [Methylophaga sp.]|tara:strand:+ start:78551 stop:79303 length:753 start_codon:yes stop_codon:yes gene_type:complete
MSFSIIIPARYASSRLPGKPLMDIAGKPMIQHVYERALESDADKVIIATDDERIADTVTAFDADVCMTAETHRSGTDRLAEVVEKRQFNDKEIVINVQGDEPCLPALLINQVAADLAQHKEADMASLFSRIHQEKQVFDPNVVKVVMDNQGYALYFSRAPIPWMRDHFHKTELPPELPHYRHIGLYGYRAHFLKNYTGMAPCLLETEESLEQLRVLFHGKKIHMSEALISAGHGVDTEADLIEVRQLLAE